MTIYLVIQETQSEHGFVDTFVQEAYTERRLAERKVADYRDQDVEDGERVEGRNAQDGDWTVSYKVVEVELFRAPITSVESQVYVDSGELPLLAIEEDQ